MFEVWLLENERNEVLLIGRCAKSIMRSLKEDESVNLRYARQVAI